MKTKNIFAILSLMGLLGALSPSANALDKNFDIQAAIDNAITRNDHASLAKCYEDAARQMQAKVNEKKELLEHYEYKSYLYGIRAQDLQAHTDALIRSYEKAVKENLKEAASHRQMALQREESNYGASGAQKLSAVSEAHHSSAPGIIIVD